MRLSPLLILTLLLGLMLAACHRAAKLPDPQPVGQWQWENPLLGTWRMEIKADGTFLREATDAVDAAERKTVLTKGRWSMTVTQPEPTWVERHRIFQKISAEDAFLQKIKMDATRRGNIQLSAPGAFSFFYYAPKDAEREPGASWPGPTVAEAWLGPAPAGAIALEEKRTLRTFTDSSTGEVFLDLDERTFRKSTTARTAKRTTPLPQTHDDGADTAAAPPGAEADFLNIEAFLGVTLDLPKDWEVIDPDAPSWPASPVGSLTARPRAPRSNTSWRFMPADGLEEDVYVLLSVQPPSYTPDQVEDAEDEELEYFAIGFVKAAGRLLAPKGYFLEHHAKAERIHVGRFTAVSSSGRTVDPTKNVRSLRVYTVPTGSGTIILACCWDPNADPPWTPIIERICSSLHVADGFRLAP